MAVTKTKLDRAVDSFLTYGAINGFPLEELSAACDRKVRNETQVSTDTSTKLGRQFVKHAKPHGGLLYRTALRASAWALLVAGNYSDAKDTYLTARRLLKKDAISRARIDRVLIDVYMYLGDFKEAQRRARMALSSFGRLGADGDTAILFSSNLFSPWSGFVLGGAGSFMTLQDTAGMTNDSIIVWPDPSGLAPCWYGDSVVMYISGISQPVLLTVMLNVYTTDSVSGVQNFPNPFNTSTEISFSLGVASRVNLTAYNITGQLVTTLADQYLEVGKHSFLFDGSSVSSGVYFYRLQTETAIETRKMILLK